jgi:hypothetical protein
MKDYRLIIFVCNEPQIIIVANLETLVEYLNRVPVIVGITTEITENN